MLLTSKIKQLANALNYPEGGVPGDVSAFSFFVDGLEIQALEQSNGVILRFDLECSEELLPSFAQYAAGRLLREDAVLAWDSHRSRLFLWQALSAAADDGMLLQGFEQFADSCEWWVARCAEKEVPQSVLPDILIRP